MITDNQRREMAEDLRGYGLADNIGNAYGTIDTMDDAGYLLLRILDVINDYRDGLHYFPSHFSGKAAVELIADLIDRPACMFKPAYEPDVMGKVSLVECSKCGWTIEPWNAAGFNYCPNCGAEVES